MLRGLSRAYYVRPVVCVRTFKGVAGGNLEGKEATEENKAVRRHDEELIQKLAKQYQAEQQAKGNSSNQQHSAASTEHSRWSPKDAPHKGGEYISLDEFLVFRKEMINKIRELEDEVIALKYKVQINKQ